MKQPKNIKKQAAKSLPLEQDSIAGWVKKLKWALLAISFLVFANSIGNGYNMDDELVTRNHKLTSQGISGISEIFSSPYYSDDMGYSYGYRPIVLASYAIEHDLFGEKPAVGHLINVVLFALTCAYLFRFLNVLFGEKNYLYSFLASALFAVHPIHTEVVDSLKNRDEIFALLFSILCGIQFIKHLTSTQGKHLIWCVILFLLAILSKKSMYPMVIVLPVATALLFTVDFKKILILTLLLAIPAAIFGSEMQLQRGILLGIAPIISLSIVYFLISKSNRIAPSNLKKYLWIAPVFLIFLICYYFFLNSNSFVLLLFIPLFIWLLRLNEPIGIRVISIALLILNISAENNWLGLFSVSIPIGYASYHWINNQTKFFDLLIISAISISINCFVNANFGVLVLTLNFVFFCWLLLKKPTWAILYSLITFGLILVFTLFVYLDDSLNLTQYAYGITLLIISIYWKKQSSTQLNPFAIFFPTIGVSLLFVLFTVSDYANFSATNDSSSSITADIKKDRETELAIYRTKQNDGKSIFKEGRMLEYVENPLVITHNSSEKIATGFYSLGKYVQLLVFPKDLSFYYGYATMDIQQLSNIEVILSILIFSLLLFLLVFYANKNPWISIGFGWYLASILLFSNWIELVAGVVGERLVYLPSVGFFIGIIGLIKEFNLLEKFKQPSIIALCVIGILLAGRTMARNIDWENNYTLMTHDIKHLGNSAQANNLVASAMMGYSLDNENDLTPEERHLLQKSAISYFNTALKIYPYFFNAAYDKGRAAKIVGDTTEVINAFEQAVKIGNKNFLFPYYELQDIYLAQRDLKNYLAINKQLIVLDSLNPKIYSHLANSYYFLKEFDSSEIVLQKAVKKFPNNNELNLNLQEVSRAKQAWENEKAASK